MSIIPNLSIQARKHPVSEPQLNIFMQGVGFLAVGIAIGSIFLCEVSIPVRFVSLAIGCILCTVGIPRIIKYRNDSKAFKEYTPQWDKSRGMFDRFAQELNNWYAKDELPKSCDGDTAYYLRLQQDRLKNRHLLITYRITPGKNTLGTSTIPQKTLWYTADRSNENIDKHLAFLRDGSTIYERDTNEFMYDTVLHSPNEAQLDSLTLTCPNCGAVSLVSELTQGCRYCNTQFQITDLYPRVTNFHFVYTKSSSKGLAFNRNIVSISIAVVFVLSLIGMLADPDIAPPLALFGSYFTALLGGGIFGLLLSNILLIGMLFDRDGRKRIPMFRSLAAKGTIKRALSQYDPYFSFEKFEGQIISLIRMTVFAKDPAALTAYKADTLDTRFQDIIEMTHISSFVVKHIEQKGNILRMTLRTWWINYNDVNGKIKKTGDCIDVTISKDVSHTETPGFSITSVNCHNCGGSFDAVRQHTCPYCQTEYHMEQENWVVEDMQLIR